MHYQKVTISADFKKKTIRAILSIVLFILTYILLIVLAIGFTILCGFLGLWVISIRLGFYGMILSLGIWSMSVLVLIYLFKFIFKKHRVERSHLIEITKEDQPELFSFISEIVNEVKTEFPKKIYLSAEVNAAVFYDSSFWSMFFPIKKNLQIGVGLINAISTLEFKAILAHEFGHFSQRTMKVGSYVYNVNQIIYNLLFDNDSFDSVKKQWGDAHAVIDIFVQLAGYIVQAIQKLLITVYEDLNISYMDLSREMEFHADEIAASVAGSQPLISSLLRLNLANHSFEQVLFYYSNKINDCIRPKNIYPQQKYVMNFLAKESKLPFENDLPFVSLSFLNRFNKSKLNIENQWASHPSTEDRVHKLQQHNINIENNDNRLAASLFNNFNEIQQQMTAVVFSSVGFEHAPEIVNSEQFIEEYTHDYRQNAFPDIFNNYYNNKNPTTFDIDKMVAAIPEHNHLFNELFSNDAVDWVYQSISIITDITILKDISDGKLAVNSFDYDGKKYIAEDSTTLIAELQKESQKLNDKIAQNDSNIFIYFLRLARNQTKEKELIAHYQDYFEIENSYEKKQEIYTTMVNESSFMYQKNHPNLIMEKLEKMKAPEKAFKTEINLLLSNPVCQMFLSTELKDLFNQYLSEEWTYFTKPHYDNKATLLLSKCLNEYPNLLSKTYFHTKKNLLEFQASLELKNE